MAKLLVFASKIVRASTLVETLVASVIIIVVFTIASLTLNNVFRLTIRSNTQAIDTRINKVLYLYQHNKIDRKYQEDFKHWEINVSNRTENNRTVVVIEAVNQKAKKTILKKVVDAQAE